MFEFRKESNLSLRNVLHWKGFSSNANSNRKGGVFLKYLEKAAILSNSQAFITFTFLPNETSLKTSSLRMITQRSEYQLDVNILSNHDE